MLIYYINPCLFRRKNEGGKEEVNIVQEEKQLNTAYLGAIGETNR